MEYIHIPFGVQGVKCGVLPRSANNPALKGWNPSTSLSKGTQESTTVSDICEGRGSCTRIP